MNTISRKYNEISYSYFIMRGTSLFQFSEYF